MRFAKEKNERWETIPFHEYPYFNFGMRFPRSVTVVRAPQNALLVPSRPCGTSTSSTACGQRSNPDQLHRPGPCKPAQNSGWCRAFPAVSLWAMPRFVLNAFEAFKVRTLDMESAAIAHVADANEVPYIAVRSRSGPGR